MSVQRFSRVKGVTPTGTLVCGNSLTPFLHSRVQQIWVKFDVVIAPNSGYIRLLLWHCSSFSFSVENVLVSRFVPHSKCAVSKGL